MKESLPTDLDLAPSKFDAMEFSAYFCVGGEIELSLDNGREVIAISRERAMLLRDWLNKVLS